MSKKNFISVILLVCILLAFIGNACSFIHPVTAQKMKFSIKDFFSKRDQICSFLRIWSHLLKISLMENFIFCVVYWRRRLRDINFIISWDVYKSKKGDEKREGWN